MPSKTRSTRKLSQQTSGKKAISRSNDSKKSNSSPVVKATQKKVRHSAFLPVLVLTAVLWLMYRSVLDFPVWFDESIGKALFFGMPVWVYFGMTGFTDIRESFEPYKLRSGILQGLAFGGIFGFVAATLSLISREASVEYAPLFMSQSFWWEFAMALLTGFWETLFFYSFVMAVIMGWRPYWAPLSQILLAALVFLLFHIPNLSRQVSAENLAVFLMLTFLFALGQAFLFWRQRNAYTLVVTHALWGMVLLVHITAI